MYNIIRLLTHLSFRILEDKSLLDHANPVCLPNLGLYSFPRVVSKFTCEVLIYCLLKSQKQDQISDRISVIVRLTSWPLPSVTGHRHSIVRAPQGCSCHSRIRESPSPRIWTGHLKEKVAVTLHIGKDHRIPRVDMRYIFIQRRNLMQYTSHTICTTMSETPSSFRNVEKFNLFLLVGL